MSYDTSKDPRILVAKRACTLLGKSLLQRSGVRLHVAKERLADQVVAAESAVMALMYSYLEPDELSVAGPMKQLVDTAGELEEGLAPILESDHATHLIRANLAWCLRVLLGLPDRLRRQGAGMESGVDLVAVEVRTVARKGSLWLTRVADGVREYPVMTNLPGIRPGTVVAVAFLPPREVGGEVSEAMYLGDEPRSEPPGTVLGADGVDGREAASILHEELAKH